MTPNCHLFLKNNQRTRYRIVADFNALCHAFNDLTFGREGKVRPQMNQIRVPVFERFRQVIAGELGTEYGFKVVRRDFGSTLNADVFFRV